ncbi:aldo/keto reductase [Thermoactinomyces daqus]|uniref:Aldo/keto reductase n=1 Tax=Thermoactinomyces daqus TaxID=1329516 RepID=A0A7W2AK51_9BACL|nr:aldo/keto reductase [Thermoactinomyces daqus]MBA4544573.1 aldo/keto reductase [Thermoactinomyces daqus]
MKYNSLGNTGIYVSELGFGCSPLGGVFGFIEEKEAIKAVRTAIELGITYFDVSPYYGSTRAELVLGKALKGVHRDQFVLSTKVGRYDDKVFDFSKDRILKSIHESLLRLGVDELDLVFVHDVEFGSTNQIIQETLPALHAQKRAGLVKAIGVSGLPIANLREIVKTGLVDVVLSYCQYTLFNTTLGHHLNWFSEQSVGVINASPFAMGLLTNEGPPLWHPASPTIRKKCAQVANVARSRGLDLAQLAFHFSIEAKGVASTLVGMKSEAQVRKNMSWLKEPIDEEAMIWIRSRFKSIQNQIWPSGF